MQDQTIEVGLLFSEESSPNLIKKVTEISNDKLLFSIWNIKAERVCGWGGMKCEHFQTEFKEGRLAIEVNAPREFIEAKKPYFTNQQ